MGTPTHDDDLRMILPALRSICAKYENVEIQILGVIGHTSTKALLKGLPVRFIKPEIAEVDYPLFMLWFTGRIQWDIGLAPLVDSPFTRFKSDIKFLDYTAAGVTGIFSKVPAYQDTVQHNQYGLVVDNTAEEWEHAIAALIEDRALGVSIRRGATQYLYSERIIKKNPDKWLTPLNTIIRNI